MLLQENNALLLTQDKLASILKPPPLGSISAILALRQPSIIIESQDRKTIISLNELIPN